MGLNLVEIWLAKAFASCCGVNLAEEHFWGLGSLRGAGSLPGPGFLAEG
jgi:hypothetical protein